MSIGIVWAMFSYTYTYTYHIYTYIYISYIYISYIYISYIYISYIYTYHIYTYHIYIHIIYISYHIHIYIHTYHIHIYIYVSSSPEIDLKTQVRNDHSSRHCPVGLVRWSNYPREKSPNEPLQLQILTTPGYIFSVVCTIVVLTTICKHLYIYVYTCIIYYMIRYTIKYVYDYNYIILLYIYNHKNHILYNYT
jgi:hypothetical protein